MNNPLLTGAPIPDFAAIRAEHVEPAIDRILADNRAELEGLLAANENYTWNNLIAPIEAMDDRLNRAWSPVSHLNAVLNSEALRQAYNTCLPKLSEYATERGQNERLYRAYRQIAEGPEYQRLDTVQRKMIDDALRDFRLSGVALPEESKARYKAIMQRLAQLGSQFQDNVLDATQAWEKPIAEASNLAGLPESSLAMLRQNAERQGRDGWLLNLEFPCYFAVLNYADDRALREELYTAYSTRASDQGPQAGQWDNASIMEDILALRCETAQLLGFASYAEYSLATKMAETPEQVLGFLDDLARRAKPQAERDLAELTAFAREQHGVDELVPWDIPYYSEKLRQHRYEISQEELRPYFPEPRVVSGLFAVVERLFGVRFEPDAELPVWHEDVRGYRVLDADGQLRGRFFLDPYARSGKRGGAWMDSAVTRRRTADGVQIPVAYLVCNFTPPVGERPALFSHDEVQTLFHEFGHGLHHLLTRIDYTPVAGIHGVEWDAVELPSQFLENWCWAREALDLIAGHFETGEPIPEALYERMIAARNFQSAMQMVRQLEFSLFDFRLHHDYDPVRGARVLETLEDVREQVAVIRPPAWNRFANSFLHIFAGGYAAGYYSYKWAEVLSADAFSRFEEQGVFDPESGADFLENVLEVGGSRDAMTNFKAFRGREPSIEPLLRHSGIAVAAG